MDEVRRALPLPLLHPLSLLYPRLLHFRFHRSQNPQNRIHTLRPIARLPMSPAAGGAAPTQTAASSALAPLSIATPEPDRAAPPPPPQQQQANRRDPPGQLEGPDPGNAAARKTAWNVPAPPPAAAGPGGIIGGDASWPALAESARAWPKSASSDSLKSLSDGSAPSASEDLIVSSPLPHPVANPISTGSNPTSTSPPPNATAAASSQQNGSTNQPNPVRHGGSNGGNSGGGSGGNGSSGGRGAGNNSSGDGNNGSGGDGNWSNGSIGSGRGCNSGYGDTNSSNGGGSSNMNNSVHSGGTSGNDSSRRAPANNNWNGHGRGGGGSNNNGTGSGDGINRNSGGSGNLWNNNARNGSGSSNGFGGRGGRNRRDHERGASFTPRNYPRLSPVPHQQQQPGIYQPGPFHRPPPPPPPAHFMVPQPFVPYAPPFAYPGDVQAYPFYLTPVEQFQNMHLVRQPMQPLWVHQDQQNLQAVIRLQMEFYFSTNNLCHDTYLRRHMNDQGWVPIDLITQFNRMRRFTDLVDTNYILDAIRGSEILEVQGNNVRRRNDWAEWLLH